VTFLFSRSCHITGFDINKITKDRF
jgi:hypothetical protein